MANTEISRDGSKKVSQVCQEIMTREDEALAYRLQDEEFQTHYIRNREERGTARIDVRAAKDAYLDEVKHAGLLREGELQRLAEDDAWLASELQHRLDEEENLETQQRTASEMQDEEYARFLQEREKEKVKKERQRRLQNRIDRERKELERMERQKQSDTRSNEESKPPYGFPHSVTRKENVPREEPRDSNGWSVDLSRKDEMRNSKQQTSEPARQTVAEEEEKARQQELEDEELARRLQRREDEKLRKLMEERDRRLAMKMQRKETEEYRRERAERQSRKAHSTHEHENEATGHDDQPPRNDGYKEDRTSGHQCHEPKHCDPKMHYYEEPVLHRKTSNKTSSDNNNELAHGDEASFETRPKSNSITSRSRPDIPVYETVVPPALSQKENAPNREQDERVVRDQLQHSRANTPQKASPNDSTQRTNRQHFTNIAASIDPTFKGEFEEQPVDQDKIWAIGDSGIKVSSVSKPAPLIQNTKRKQSKGGKDKEKCKQQ